MAKATAHGLTRGVITAAQGGKFGAGFASGFVSSGFAVGKDTFESLKGAAVAARTAVMAVVGGVTSEITGGKFANGAITWAFVHLFNSEKLNQYEQNQFNKNEGYCTNEGYFLLESDARISEDGNFIYSNIQYSGPSADKVGFYSSALASLPGPQKYPAAFIGLMIDNGQGDTEGFIRGLLSLVHPIFTYQDLKYGYEQAYKQPVYDPSIIPLLR